MTTRFSPADLGDPEVRELLATHLTLMRSTSPACSVHALDLTELARPGVTVRAMHDETGRLCGVGALQDLGAGHGELKSMHIVAEARGRGLGAQLLEHLLAAAGSLGMTRVSLETGSRPDFAGARRLYARHGFVDCPPFADYVPDPESVFMTRRLPGGQ